VKRILEGWPWNGRLLAVCRRGQSLREKSKKSMEPNRNPDFDLVLRSVRIVVWELDPHDRVIRCYGAPGVLDISGGSDVLGMERAVRKVYPQDRRDVIAHFRCALSFAEPAVHHFRLQPQRRAAPLWVENHMEIVRDATGKLERVRGVLLDITSHKQALAALTAADLRKNDFIATLGHEFRSPLTAISAAAQILIASAPEQGQGRHCVDMIRRQATHLGRLVEDLLDVTRVVRDRLEIQRQPVDLRQTLQGALDTVDALVKHHRHSLQVMLPEEPVTVEADRSRIAQVFENILTNAAKYTPAGGTIGVTLERSGEWAAVRVRDSGVGLAPEDLALVFEPFYQVGASITRAHGGLGIGLALVRRIVQLHSGTVHVVSAGRGCGCEFTVRLPCLTETTAIRTVDRPVTGIPLDSSFVRRILVADDDSDAAEALALGLRMCGHKVAVAFDGAEAIRRADEFHPHVALIDLTMPIRPGHEVARELRSRNWALEQGIFIIALTGWSPRSLEGRIDMSVFDSQIQKPVELDAVRELVVSQRPSREQVT
jgi:signal transduction histidine kinase/ActR/RegA family two-component response regulator